MQLGRNCRRSRATDEVTLSTKAGREIETQPMHLTKTFAMPGAMLDRSRGVFLVGEASCILYFLGHSDHKTTPADVLLFQRQRNPHLRLCS